MEAHLPNVFALGAMEAPGQVLVLVFSTIANGDQVPSALGVTLARELPPGFALHVWPIHGGPGTLDERRSAGCQLPLPPHGAQLALGHTPRRVITVEPSNNSLKLTRRAALLGPLARPAGGAHDPGESARFRRAA